MKVFLKRLLQPFLMLFPKISMVVLVFCPLNLYYALKAYIKCFEQRYILLQKNLRLKLIILHFFSDFTKKRDNVVIK